MANTIDIDVGDSLLVGPQGEQGERGPAGSIASDTQPETTDAVVWVDTSVDTPQTIDYTEVTALKTRYENLIKNQTSQSPSDAEIVDARGGYNLLGNRINALATKKEVQAVTSGSPLVASNVSEMTDTSHVYVNTSDGYWYYYNGTEWTQGDVYQSTRIGENEQVTFNQVVGAIDNYYTIANLNTWSKWSSDSSLLNGITNTDNGLNIQLPSTINKNVVISKNNIDFHSKKVILGFDIIFNSKIGNDDKFNIVLNDATSLLTIHSNDYALNVNNHIEIEFNDTLSATGKLSLVCGFPIDCTIENIILKEYIDTSNLPYNNLPEALETLKKIENGNIETKDLILPNTIPCVRGLETNVFYDNILKNTNINSVERVDIESSIGGIFNRLKDRWRILLSSANSDIIQTFKLYLNDNNTPTKTYPVNIKVLDNTVGSGKTKKIMFIGDSLTDMNVYEQELLRMFNSDEMNIELVGTRGSSTTAMHEGRSGWTTKNYCTNASVGNTTNAFYNPSTNTFDFSYYMSNNPSLSDVDYVFINMGTNDMANSNSDTITYYETMVNSIKAFNSNISVFIGLCPPLAIRNDNILFKNKRLDLMKLLLNKYDNKESNKIFICPLCLNFDAYNGFPTQILTGDRHTNEECKVITDNTHPYNSEFYKMADTIYCTIKYAVNLEN